ncbi:hypothetical protein ACPCSC_28710 [Streptomyces lavendulocolor]|uniref:MmyB family transcriptional regulator n=1 Tax=Streptomyces lavendulocolor TaxID=67316 RepID=UPI003C2DD6D8
MLTDRAASSRVPREPTRNEHPAVGVIESARQRLKLGKGDLAQQLGITPRTLLNWYRDPLRLAPESVEQLADVLAMSDPTRAALYELTGHRPPAQSNPQLRSSPEMAVYQRYIDAVAHPSTVIDHMADVVLANEPYRALFRNVPRHRTAMPLRNGLRYILFHPLAYQQLGRAWAPFKDYWLLPAMANFSALFQQLPSDPQLVAMHEELLSTERVRTAYRELPAWIEEHGDIHVNSDKRPFWHQASGRLRHVSVLTEVHEGARAQFRHVTFVFHD